MTCIVAFAVFFAVVYLALRHATRRAYIDDQGDLNWHE